MIRDTVLTSTKVRGRTWQRLARRADFLRIGASGLRCATPGFVLQTAPHGPDDGKAMRIGFTASRKVGNAVARNRAKRRLRALADRIMVEAGDPDCDYVFIGRTETIKRDFAAMESELRRALQRLAKGDAKPATVRQ